MKRCEMLGVSSLRWARFVVLAFVPASSAAAQGATQVFVVQKGGGTADFQEIQAAVLTVSSGAVLLVKPSLTVHDYLGFTIDGKALTLVGDEGATLPRVLGRVVVQNLPAGSDVVLRRLKIDVFGAFGATEAIRLLDASGTIWLEDCVVDAVPDPYTADYGLLGAENCSSLVFIRDQLLGDPGF